MNDFNWRNQPRSTTNPKKGNVVKNPQPITFNGATLSGTMVKPPRHVSTNQRTHRDHEQKTYRC